MPQKIKIYSSAAQIEDESWTVSGTYSYDNTLIIAFPYFIHADRETTQELAGILARGYNEEFRKFTLTSFALTLKMSEELDSRILWISWASKALLNQHSDLYEFEVTDEVFNHLE